MDLCWRCGGLNAAIIFYRANKYNMGIWHKMVQQINARPVAAVQCSKTFENIY